MAAIVTQPWESASEHVAAAKVEAEHAVDSRADHF